MHIDDGDLIKDGGILEKVVKGELDKIKARVRLEAGYVVDMKVNRLRWMERMRPWLSILMRQITRKGLCDDLTVVMA